MSGQHLATRFRKPSKNPASALSQRRRMVIIAAPPVRMLDVFDPAGSVCRRQPVAGQQTDVRGGGCLCWARQDGR